MKLAVSNIAWSADEDCAAFELLRNLGIEGLEIAPPRVWPEPATVSQDDALAYRRDMKGRGFNLVAFQSLLFGKNHWNLFQPETAPECRDYLIKLGRLASRLGVRTLVFGSPRNRAVPETMEAEEALAKATEFFRPIGAAYTEMNVVLGLEPNPAAYACNFIQTIDEAAELVRRVDSPGFRLHLDAGEMQMNDEAIETVVPRHLDIVSHVHASEPMLAPLSAWGGHRRLAAVLKSNGYNGWLSLEMKRPEKGLEEVQRSAALLAELYS